MVSSSEMIRNIHVTQVQKYCSCTYNILTKKVFVTYKTWFLVTAILVWASNPTVVVKLTWYSTQLKDSFVTHTLSLCFLQLTCVVFSGLTTYFLLVPFVWLLAEAVFMNFYIRGIATGKYQIALVLLIFCFCWRECVCLQQVCTGMVYCKYVVYQP